MIRLKVYGRSVHEQVRNSMCNNNKLHSRFYPDYPASFWRHIMVRWPNVSLASLALHCFLRFIWQNTGLRVKYLLFCPISTKYEFDRHRLVEVSSIRFHENLSIYELSCSMRRDRRSGPRGGGADMTRIRRF